MKRLFLLAFVLTSGCLKEPAKEEKNSFFKVVSSSYAKELCSCLFVVGQSKEYCMNYARQIVPVRSFQVNDDQKSVIATAFNIQSKAQHRSSQLGCRLE